MKWINCVFVLLTLYGKFRGNELFRAFMVSGKQ